jgi:hypothetical protein
LESDEENWQQALAIRLYFEFHAPLSRVLSGKWSQIVDKCWYPYWPDERELWFECRESIDDGSQKLLDRIKRLAARDFGSNKYWFPSRFARNVDHIRVVEPAWQRALHQCELRYYPLREFSRSFREFNNPSYYASFLRQYGPMVRKASNMARVSKTLLAARK